MTLSGKGVLPGSRFTTSAGLMPRVNRNSAMSPTTLLTGRHLDDVAEELVHVGVGARDFGPAMRRAPIAAACSLQVRVLAAGHFVQIHFGAAGLRRSVERRVKLAHLLPVIGELVQRVEVEPGVARRVLQRGDDGVEVRLAECEPLIEAMREIDDVHAGIARLAGSRPALMPLVSCVWKWIGNADLFLQRLDQLATPRTACTGPPCP